MWRKQETRGRRTTTVEDEKGSAQTNELMKGAKGKTKELHEW